MLSPFDEVFFVLFPEMTEEVAAETPPAPPKGTGSAETEKPPENNEVSAEQKKGKKRKNWNDIPKEFLEPTRERSSRKAASKAAMQISMNIMHQASNQEITDDVPLQNGVSRGKKVKPNDEILSSSPIKFKAGPRCTKVARVKPGPRSKRRRNFQIEDLYLDQPGNLHYF